MCSSEALRKGWGLLGRVPAGHATDMGIGIGVEIATDSALVPIYISNRKYPSCAGRFPACSAS